MVPQDRSLMNIPFVTGDKELDAAVVAASKEAGFDNLKGHKSVGGLRASVYNAMPMEGAQALGGVPDQVRGRAQVKRRKIWGRQVPLPPIPTTFRIMEGDYYDAYSGY